MAEQPNVFNIDAFSPKIFHDGRRYFSNNFFMSGESKSFITPSIAGGYFEDLK
jgi:hypothetical protein